MGRVYMQNTDRKEGDNWDHKGRSNDEFIGNPAFKNDIFAEQDSGGLSPCSILRLVIVLASEGNSDCCAA